MRRAEIVGSENSARELVLVAFGLPLLTLLVLTVIVSVTVLAAGGGFGGIGAAIGSAWLVIHQVPLTIAGVSLGALPLLPTAVLVALAAKAVAPAIGDRRTPSELAALFAAAVGGPLLISALAVAIVMDGQSVLPVQSPTPLVAFGCTAAVHIVATGLAVGAVRWREWAAQRHLSRGQIDDLIAGARLGILFVGSLIGIVAVLTVVMMVVRFGAIGNLIDGAHSFDGYLGLVLLSLLYLPNLAVAGAGALVGADVNIGQASLTLYDAHGGAIPPLPIFAVLPDGDLGWYGAFGFLLTAGVGVYVGLKSRTGDLRRNVTRVLTTAGIAAFLMVVLTWASSGDLGELGRFGPSVPVAGLYTFGVVAATGLIVALIHQLLPSTRAARPASRAVDDYEDVDDDATDVIYSDDEYEDDEYYEEDEYYDETDDDYNEYYVDELDSDELAEIDADAETAQLPPVELTEGSEVTSGRQRGRY